jgi:hypothetical protein
VNRADRKAQIVASRATARRHPVPMLVGEPSPGWQMWKVGQVAVVMPRLLPGAPSSVRRHYRQRILANATGECPGCGSVVGDPEDGSVQANLAHDGDCPVRELVEHVEPWLDPRSFRAHSVRSRARVDQGNGENDHG